MPVADLARRYVFQILRAGFRLMPMPQILRDQLRQRFIRQHAAWIPEGPQGQPPSGYLSRRPRRAAGVRAIGYRTYRASDLPNPPPAQVIAFYLPQFHPIPENDAWWGDGFTEWNNVSRALPQFEGHMQPRLPGELGFYDLRCIHVMRRQMQLASEYGISAFCTYFYWFAGKTLLESPLQQWLNDPSLSLPICLCWANENWSRRWDGRADEILISQAHSDDDDWAFIAHVSRYLKDGRYLRVMGKPLLLVYRPGLLPDPKATAERWRSWCRTNGIGEIYLAYVQSFDRVDPYTIGFDAAVEFPPNNTSMAPITAQQQLINPAFRGDVFDWRELAQISGKHEPAYPLYPGVNPGWDNEPRRSGRGRVFLHASPRGYRDWLRSAIETTKRRTPTSPMVFVNAWNEWAEGAVLEPDSRLGYAWLEATRQALQPNTFLGQGHYPCAVIHARRTDGFDTIMQALRHSGISWRIVVATTADHESWIRTRLLEHRLDAQIELFESRQGDTWPFLQVADRLLDEGTTYVLRLDAGCIDHGAGHPPIDLLLSQERAARILDAFEQRSGLGLVVPEGHIQRTDPGEHPDRDPVAAYAYRRLGIPPAPQPCFLTGPMFWARLTAIRPLLDANFDLADFEGDIAGFSPMARAIEHAFVLAAASAKLETLDAATACELLARQT
jgi:lipopolysaccharide biosynthesis protein